MITTRSLQPDDELADTYEQFVARLKKRPDGMSPLRYMATNGLGRKPYSEWVLRWLRERD
jgi:hypothetical protein